MLTSGTLSALQEVLASWIAKDVSSHGHYINSRVPKMAVYGAFISAPLGHFLISILQRVFKGRTSLSAKIMQILVSNLIVCRSPYLHMFYRTHAEIGAGLANPKHCVPRLHGHHRWCKDLPSDPRYRQSWLYARHEGQLDHLTLGIGLCPEILA